MASTEAPTSLCEEFRRLMDQPYGKGIDRYQLQRSAQPGDEQYFNLDVDGDDISDLVMGGCSNSNEPADPCDLSVEMSSGKKIHFVFKETERFYLVRYRSKFYVVVTDVQARERKGARAVLELDANGIQQICTKL